MCVVVLGGGCVLMRKSKHYNLEKTNKKNMLFIVHIHVNFPNVSFWWCYFSNSGCLKVSIIEKVTNYLK